MARPMGSAIVSSSSGVQPADHSRGPRGAVSFSGIQNRTYAVADRQNLEASPDVGTSTLSVFSYNEFALIYLGSTLSHVTLLIAKKFKRTPEY